MADEPTQPTDPTEPEPINQGATGKGPLGRRR